MKDMLELTKRGDTDALARYVNSLVLPHPDAWFKSVFGDPIGEELSGSFERTRLELPLSFPDVLADLLRQHRTSIEVVRFTHSCNAEATPEEYPILILRLNSQPLYDVRFFSGFKAARIAYFAYVDNAFRYVGNLHVDESWPIRGSDVPGMSPSGASGSPKTVRADGKVVMARLIHQVPPVYPPEAMYAGIQGTVLFHAVIGADGNIHGLQVVQGQCWLTKAALKAVSQWRYKPTLLLGKPVAVDTTITVTFALGR